MSIPPAPFPRDPAPAHRAGRPDDTGWQLTLADMMTLLLTFFIVLLAVSSPDEDQLEAVSRSMSGALSKATLTRTPEATPGQMSGEMSGAVRDKTPDIFALQVRLARMLQGQSDAVRLGLRPRSVAISLSGGVFFQSGSATLTPRARDLLERITAQLTRLNLAYTIEGHTDDQPITSSRYPSNWELSAARAASVGRFLIERGVQRDHVTIRGHADTRPLQPNTTATNRAENRRVVILVSPLSP